MQAQYNPLIEGVQAKIDNLTTLKDLLVSAETQEICAGMAAANPGGIVEAIAAANLPTMSSSGSDSSNNSLASLSSMISNRYPGSIALLYICVTYNNAATLQ